MILLFKNTHNNSYIKRGAVLKTIARYMICLFVFIGLAPSGLQAQSCVTSGNPTIGSITYPAGIPLDGTTIPYTKAPDCPPIDRDAVEDNRGFMIGCNQPDCSTAPDRTPSDIIPTYNSSCPLFDITYRVLTSPDNATIFAQYWNACVGSELTIDYRASHQGFTNQLFCELDANGYPAPPFAPSPAAPGTPLTGLSGLISTLPAESEDIQALVTELGGPTTGCGRNDDATDETELIQADFWVVIPSFVRSLGVRFDGNRDDQALFMIGPSVSQMCATADFIGSEAGNEQGNQSLYYNVPTTAPQVCGGTLLRARMYINDLADRFRVNPEFDFGGGTFTSVGAGNIYPVTGANDDTPPNLIYEEVLTGFQDGDGNIFDSDLNLVSTGCLVEELDVPPVTCSIMGNNMAEENMQNVTYSDSSPGVASYAWSVIAGDATINGPNTGSSVNIDFGTSNSTLQLRVTDADGCPSICTKEVSVTAVMCPAPPSVTGGTFCAGTAIFSFTGAANAVITYTLDGGTATTITLDALGVANLPVTASSTLTLGSVAYPSAPTCNQTLSASANITIIDLATASVTGGTFCAGTAIFSFTGTPNAVITYTLDGVAATITLDAMGMANLPVTASSTLTLVSAANSSAPMCSQTFSASANISANITVIDDPAITSVTGGTFCGAATANFSITGTPNTIVSYNIDGGTTATINLDAMGMATVAVSNTSSLSLVSIAYSSTPTCSQLLTESAGIILDGPTCFTPVIPVYTFSLIDPCNCDNPNNITLPDGTFLIADFIRVDASQYTNPIVSIFSADANFLDNTGVPINPATATFVSQGGGIFELPYYVLSDAPASFIIDVNGDQQAGGGSTTNCFCNVLIPTLSQWGLLIYGLLILNLFIGVLYRKKWMLE